MLASGWYIQWNKSTVHYFHKQKTLCNHPGALNGNSLKYLNDDNYPRKFCKKCKYVLMTYSDLDNQFLRPKPQYVGVKSS